MKLLKDKILSEGKVVNEHILKVDSFINHQVDPVIMDAVAKEFAEHFKNKGITKIATIESSGIAPALFTAKEMGLPLIIFKKQPSQILYHNLYQTMIGSYTKETSYELTLSKDYITSDDHVLIIDDFLANGEAASGAIRLIRMSYATVAGLGVLIEKSFEPGHDKVEGNGIEVFSLARIKSLSNDTIEFLD